MPTEADGKISNLRNVTDHGAHRGRSLARQPVAQELRAADRPRLGSASGTERPPSAAASAFSTTRSCRSTTSSPAASTRRSRRVPRSPTRRSRTCVANFDANAYIRAQLQTVNYDLQTPYIMQFNVERPARASGDWDVMVGYVGSRGQEPPASGRREPGAGDDRERRQDLSAAARAAQPAFTGIWQRVTDAESFYNSFQLAAKKRFSHGWRAQVSYTFSRVRWTTRAASTPRTSATSFSTGWTGTTATSTGALGLPCQAQPDLQLRRGSCRSPARRRAWRARSSRGGS